MPTILLYLLLLAGVVCAFFGSPRQALAALAVTWMLVPGGARLPGVVSGHLFLHRVILVAALLGLARQVVAGRLDRRMFAVRGIHAAFAAYVVAAFVNGVLLAEPRIPFGVNLGAWYSIAEQMVFFLVILALIRAVGARDAAVIVTAVAGVMAAITLSEHLQHWSYGAWFSRHLHDPAGLLKMPLEVRGSHPRVRGAATFALEYGWMAAMLLPLTAAVAFVHRRRPELWLVPASLFASVMWSWSRSAYTGLAVGAVVLLLGVAIGRTRQLALVGTAGILVAALLVQGSVRKTLDLGAAGGDADPRFERLPGILEAVAHRPIRGLGLGGLLNRRIQVVDISWVLTYATLGVLGVIALGALMLAAIHAVTRFTTASPSPGRIIAAGAAAAAVSAPLGLFAFDLANLWGATATIWGLTALAVVASEEIGALPIPLLRRRRLVPPLAVGLGILGGVVGIVLALTVPARTTVLADFTTMAPRILALREGSSGYPFKVLSTSGCVIVDEAEVPASAGCLALDQMAGGVGEVRIQSTNATDVETTLDLLATQLRKGFHRSTLEVVSRSHQRPNWATTAPLWLLAIGAGLGAVATDARSPLAARRRNAMGRPATSRVNLPLRAVAPGDHPGSGSPSHAPGQRPPRRTTRAG